MKNAFTRISYLTAIVTVLLAQGPLPGRLPVAQAAGSINLTTLGAAYIQSFNTLASSGTSSSLPVGWWFSESGTNANDLYTAGNGSLNTGDTYSFGATGASDRALGGLQSGALIPTTGAQFTNNTGETFSSLEVSYTGEQWRMGYAGRADRLDFQYSLDATSLTSGTWTDVNSLDFSSPTTAGTVGTLDGNLSGNRTTITYTITGLSIADGVSFWIRFSDFNATNADDGLAVDDFSITPGNIDFAPTVSDTIPANAATLLDLAGNITITFSEAVNVTAAAFNISCAPSGAHTFALSDGPATFTLDPSINFVGADSCTVTINAADVTDQDVFDPPDTMAANYTFTFTVADICAQPFTHIPAIQGSGDTVTTTAVQTTQGVVVGDYEGASPALGGFYIQDPAGDGDPATSDGIFIYNGSNNSVNMGDLVSVTGSPVEYNNQGEINATSIVKCGTGAVMPTDVTLPFESAAFPERYEGMLVRLPQPLVIAEYYNYDRYGEIVLARPLNGETRPFTGTAVETPGTAANARTLANSLSRIILDDANNAQNPAVLRHPNGQPFSLANRFRGGDTLQNTVGILGDATATAGRYRIFPTGPATYTAANPRPASSAPVGGAIRVAAMNTLNFFVTADYPTGNANDNKCGPANNVECRGWDSDQPLEFERQRVKLLSALSGLNADVIGLNELENSTGVEPLDSIVSGLAGYASINTGVIGTDAIKVGLIYRTAVVAPVGKTAVLQTSEFLTGGDTTDRNRPALAQTFEVVANGPSKGQRFIVVISHLKSKGSACDTPDAGDGQGNCNAVRTNAARLLVDWLATDPTGTGDPDILLLGDYNSYAMEDPITAIKQGADDISGTADDFTNLIEKYRGKYAYSYTFDGQVGYLDHALASASMLNYVTGAADWHINSDEPGVLDYDTSFKPDEQDVLYEPNAYRTSDHDPVIVGISFTSYRIHLPSIMK
jgi:uncharacterized protein